jgi:hypothetical protein
MTANPLTHSPQSRATVRTHKRSCMNLPNEYHILPGNHRVLIPIQAILIGCAICLVFWGFVVWCALS